MGAFGVASYLVRMVPAARWLVVALLALAVAAPPTLLHLRPVADSDIGAEPLAEKVQSSTSVPWSGEVRTQGSLDVPLDSSSFGGIARLLGEQGQLRVWWRDADRWRIDRLSTTGETDLVRAGRVMARWNYEEDVARLSSYSPIRLPDDNDVVPPALAARLLDGARGEELSRLPARRIAGRSAVGLRLVPADPASTIRRVDVWSMEDSGLPLRVEVYGDDSAHPTLTSQMTSVHPGNPNDEEIGFEVPMGIHLTRTPTLDDVARANAFAPFLLPPTLAGLARRGEVGVLGAVGVYGRGPTALLALPLRDSTAHGLHEQLAKSRHARESGDSVAVEAGPLSVLLLEGDGGNFLLTGTVTPAALRQAGTDLVHGAVRTR